MKLDKPTLLRLALVLGGCVVLYWALCNLALLGAALGMLAGVLFPLTLGFCIAFVLNVPMRFLERHLFPRTQKPVLKRLRRPLCILISLVFILAVLTTVFWLVVPELVNALVVLANTVPPFLAKVTAWLQGNADRFPQLESWLAGLDIDWAKTGRDIITYLRGEEIDIRAERTAIANVDGECGPRDGLHVRVLPHAARFVLPAPLAAKTE